MLSLSSFFQKTNKPTEGGLSMSLIKKALPDVYQLFETLAEEVVITNMVGDIIYSNRQLTSSPFTSVYNLEAEKPNLYSAFRQVLMKKQRISAISTDHNGMKLLTKGMPIKDSTGSIQWILITITDMAETVIMEGPPSIKKEDEITTSFLVYSDNMKKVLQQAKNVASTSATVLLIGESGVGKEMVATEIHKFSSRSHYPFIKVNCGAIPEKLLESELFGYKKGAFTGADSKGKSGYFTQAHKGILFLDEISEMPLNLQVKLLRVLQEREVIPLGATTPVKIDVQIIAATNRNLEELVEKGEFREDLYYRLHVIPIYIPPLRERPEEIRFLANLFIDKYNELYNRKITLTDSAFEELTQQAWPGNVRELENIIQRVVVTSEDIYVDPAFLRNLFPNQKAPTSKSYPIVTQIIPLEQAMNYVEEKLITMAMNQYKSIKHAAEVLQVSQPTMSRKYKKIREKDMTNPLDSMNLVAAELNKHLISIAVVTAASINVEDIKQLLHNHQMDNPIYQRLQKQLTNIRMIEGQIEWNYIFCVKPDHTIYNVVSDQRLNLAPGEEYNGPKEIMECMFQAMDGKVGVTPIYEDSFGKMQSSVTPIKDEEGQIIAVLGSDFSEAYVNKKHDNIKKLLKS